MKITLQDIQVRLPADGRKLFELPSFVVESGRKILINGESGKGKTTLLHMIAGLFAPAAGSVQVGDYRLTDMSDPARAHFRRKHVGMIFQKLNLIEHLTAAENIELAASGDVAAALKSVGLADAADKRSSVLSLGEQQRVAVARVLAAQPSLILADEPTSSLDEKNARKVMELLLTAAADKTLIVVSHDARLESFFSERLRFEYLVRA